MRIGRPADPLDQLHVAIQANRLFDVEYLLSLYPNIHEIQNILHSYENCVRDAAGRGNASIVSKLVEAHPLSFEGMRRALAEAERNRRADVVRYLRTIQKCEFALVFLTAVCLGVAIYSQLGNNTVFSFRQFDV